MKYVKYRNEGDLLENGINWTTNWSTKFGVILKLGRFRIYFRWRSKNVGGRRILFDVDYRRKYTIGRIKFEFDTLTIEVNNFRYSIEFLEDCLPQVWEEYGRRSHRLG